MLQRRECHKARRSVGRASWNHAAAYYWQRCRQTVSLLFLSVGQMLHRNLTVKIHIATRWHHAPHSDGCRGWTTCCASTTRTTGRTTRWHVARVDILLADVATLLFTGKGAQKSATKSEKRKSAKSFVGRAPIVSSSVSLKRNRISSRPPIFFSPVGEEKNNIALIVKTARKYYYYFFFFFARFLSPTGSAALMPNKDGKGKVTQQYPHLQLVEGLGTQNIVRGGRK